MANTAAESHTSLICLQETWLTEDHSAAESFLQGFTEFCTIRKDRSHGGCSIYVNNDVTVVGHNSLSNGYCEVGMVQIEELDLSLINIYRHPAATTHSFIDSIDVILGG